MKNLLLIFTVISVLICSGCSTSFVEVPSHDQLLYAIQKVDGKEQWGVVFKKDTKISSAQNGRLHGSITTEYIGYPFAYSGIACKYDSITIEEVGPKEMFVCVKDGNKYYYNMDTNWYADENPVTKVEYVGSGKGLCMGNTHEYKFYTANGVYSTTKGPYEDINVGYFGYSIKENGKWGFYYGRHDIENSKDERYVQILPCEYDEIIEGFCSSEFTTYVFARIGNKWQTFNNHGKPVKMGTGTVNRAIQWKNQKKKDSKTFYF